MSSIPPAAASLLAARNRATAQQIDLAVIKKSLDAQEQSGRAINQILEQAAEAQRQIASGHLDIQA